MFSYGCTKDYDGMVGDLNKRYPGTKFICVGFSMGGNLVTKWLGEKRKRPDNIVAGISACQGYDAVL
jgi:abhydrolase domain-containing protein 2